MRTTFDDIGSCSFVDQLRYICFLLPFYHPKMSESGELEFYSCSESSTYHEETDHDLAVAFCVKMSLWIPPQVRTKMRQEVLKC